MATALTDVQFIALEIPQLATPFTKNGVTFTTPIAFIEAMYATFNQNVYMTLWKIFEMLTAEDRNSSLKLGEFEYTRRTGMSFDERRYYWEREYRGSLMGDKTLAPSIGYGSGIPGVWATFNPGCN